MRIVTEQNERVPTRIAIYGEPKKGKTRLATALPWGNYWGDRAIYVAWDKGSAELSSVLLQHRDHIGKVVPTQRVLKVPGKPDRSVFDPLTEAIEIASTDWQAQGYGTIIWDTMTETARNLLSAIAAQGLHGKTPGVGTPGTDAYVPQPAQGDYAAAQRCTMHILQFLFNQPINVIVLFHAEDDDSEGRAEIVGGPATVGRAAIKPIAAMFDNLIRVSIERPKIPNTMPPQYTYKRVAQTEGKSYWLTGLRTPHGTNPIPEVELEEDPINFWLKFDAVMKGDK